MRKGRVLEVVRLNRKVRGDMVTNHFQPMALFVGEFLLPTLLLPQPRVEVSVDLLGEWHQLTVLVDGEADEGDEVCENTLAARAFDLRLLQCRIGLPELGFVPEIGRFFDGVGQILDVLEPQPLFVWLTVEDLQGSDFVFVLCDELFERLDDGAGTSKGVGAEGCFDATPIDVGSATSHAR